MRLLHLNAHSQLIHLLTCVSYSEVRRAALVSVPVAPDSLDTILTRTRDTDTITRKLVYSNVLQSKLVHPRQLTIAQREDLIRAGLGDREPAVRAAVGKVIGGWFDLVLVDVKEPPDGQAWVGDDGGVMKAFIQFLGLFDVVGPGEGIAVDAVLSILTTRAGTCEVFVFPGESFRLSLHIIVQTCSVEEYWTNLTPESIVLARVFVEHCLNTNNQNCLESACLPVVTAFAFHIQEAYNGLLRILQEAELLGADGDDEESESREEELAKCEVILGELLRMALKLDYMDEIGRRKVFSVVSKYFNCLLPPAYSLLWTEDMLAHPQLPPGLIARALDLLKEIVPSERELIRVVVETVIELREEDEIADLVFDDVSP